MSYNYSLSNLKEQIAVLDPQIKEAEEEIRGVSRQLANVAKQLSGELSTEASRAELIGRESHLRAKELALLANMQELLRQKTIALENQQRGAEPPPIFSEDKISLSALARAERNVPCYRELLLFYCSV